MQLNRNAPAAATVGSMGSSFTEYCGHGFWARHGLLCVWLAALADVVPDDARPWLREAGQYWRQHAGEHFGGCVNPNLDALLATGQQARVVLGLAEAASRSLASLTDAAGYLPASWLNDRHIWGEVSWASHHIRYDYVEQIKDAFVALLRGELLPTRTAIPSPHASPPPRDCSDRNRFPDGSP